MSLPLLLLFLLHLPLTLSQQIYTKNDMLNCSVPNASSTLGYTCPSSSPPCTSYLTFRPQPPYQTPISVAFLLNSNLSSLSSLNRLPPVLPFPLSHLALVPVPCSCRHNLFLHPSTYTIAHPAETYLTIANDTLQGLSTCQAMMSRNPSHAERNLKVGDKLEVPLRCACPSEKQVEKGFRFLVSYVVNWYDDVPTIAGRFGTEESAIWEANSLAVGATIFPFTTLLVPVKETPDVKEVSAVPPVSDSGTPNPVESSRRNSTVVVIVAVVVVVVGFVALVGFSLLIWFFVRRRRQQSSLPVSKSLKDSDSAPLSGKPAMESSVLSDEVRDLLGTLAVYKFKDLNKATNFFSEACLIKGSVYHATINGDKAAVKRTKGDVFNEIKILNQINHMNLVRLSGFCVHAGDTYLVYEFVERGSLSDCLAMAGEELGWKRRIQIAYGVADGLNYLHNYITPACVHKDLKSSNVLLDGEFRPKLTDFGLARSVMDDSGVLQQTRHVIGTQGYMSPEYLEHGLITPKLDVFAFGVILLELLSGKEAVISEDGKKGEVLLSGVVDSLLEGEDVRVKLKSFVDTRLGDNYPIDSAFTIVQLAKRCVEQDLNLRPTMAEVFVTISALHSAALDWDPSSENPSADSMVCGR